MALGKVPKKKPEPVPIRLKKNDLVEVISGKEKGKTGKVLKVFREKNHVLVEKINMIKRHTRPSPTTGQGGIIEKEAPLQVSKVMLICPKRVDGEGKVAAIASLPYHDELKHVIVVDSDVDPFNEKEVLSAVATRVQAGDDVDIVRRVRGGALDPSSYIHAVGDKMLIDATKPIGRPYSERIRIPGEVMDRIKLKDWL